MDDVRDVYFYRDKRVVVRDVSHCVGCRWCTAGWKLFGYSCSVCIVPLAYNFIH